MHRFDDDLSDLVCEVGAENAATALEHLPGDCEVADDTHPTNPKARCSCGRTTQADMLVYYHGGYGCDGCWTALRRAGVL